MDVHADHSTQHPFASAPPRVRLVNAFADPYNNAVATARTCYSSRVITPADVNRDEAAREVRDRIARETYGAGHHTTLQHAHFQFTLENVSRQFLWSFLHAHPFYNSEQVSQRYVEVKPGRAFIPRLPGAQQAIYLACLERQMAAYRKLIEVLTPTAAEAFFQVFPGRRKAADKWNSAIKKKSQEIARYVLPVAIHAHLYHTISGLTLHRYHRMCLQYDTPAETFFVVKAMVAEVQAHDPLFFARIEDPIPLEQTHEFMALQSLQTPEPSSSAREFIREFDASLGKRVSVLTDYKINAEATTANAVRQVLGLPSSALSDAAALELALNPKRNPNFSNALNINTLSKLTRVLHHPHYTFRKLLSHTADSQDQRHRMTPASRPILHRHYAGGEPDVVMPSLMLLNGEARELYDTACASAWQDVDALLDAGTPPEFALCLLPNGVSIRFEESGDLLNLHHKWTTRLCYTAQEEIWRACLDEVTQIEALHPTLGKYLRPPCNIREMSGVRPPCPEGPRFCGVVVWRLSPGVYARVI
ncbi:MAG: Thymidylate synthase ThyX [Myxococcota bacterium]|nr:Thymidylate synthase ThyX [Myxococcota bacterium]